MLVWTKHDLSRERLGTRTSTRIVEIIRAVRESVALRAADASEEGVCKRATPRVGHRAELHSEAKRSTCEPDVPRDDATGRRCRGQMKPSN